MQVGGCVADTCTTQGSVYVPVVKGRMQAHEFFCSLQAFELILRREGPAALYRGWARSVSKNAPFDAVLFLLYDIGKTRITELNRAPGGTARRAMPPFASDGGGGGGAAAAAARLRAVVAAALRGSLRARVLWAALEGAVFFSALETLIPRVFSPYIVVVTVIGR
eukprot:XP_001700310.1 predicted protein [Chlamydomonas reinhardtii]